jgi:hypothetical protein
MTSGDMGHGEGPQSKNLKMTFLLRVKITRSDSMPQM